MIHLYPVNDLKEHELDGTMCPCGPRVEWNDPETGEAYAEAIVIHRSWDGREIIEEAEMVINSTGAPSTRPPRSQDEETTTAGAA